MRSLFERLLLQERDHREGPPGDEASGACEHPSAPKGQQPKRAKPAPAIRPQAKVFGETRVRPAFVFANPGSAFSPEPAPPLIVKGKAFAPLPGSNPVPWTERRSGFCAWPVDGGLEEQLSCAVECDDGETYCPAHRIARRAKEQASGKPRSTKELVRSLRRYA
jgi:hypothetical protein